MAWFYYLLEKPWAKLQQFLAAISSWQGVGDLLADEIAALPHPMALNMGHEGMVMLYTPCTLAELDVIFPLVVDPYTYVTGRAVSAPKFAARAG